MARLAREVFWVAACGFALGLLAAVLVGAPFWLVYPAAAVFVAVFVGAR